MTVAVRQQVDFIFCGHINAVPLAAGIARVLRKPLWLQVHGIDVWQPKGGVYRRGVEGAALVTAVSRHTRSKLLDWTDIPHDRVRVLPNTFDPRFAPRARRPDLAARHGLAGKRIILTVCRLASSDGYKGNDRIITALQRIREAVPNAAYLIVGSGDDEPRLQKLAESLHVREHVVFAGQCSATELPDYFALADVFAMPSTGEGFGIVFLEAAAMGLPVIAGNLDGSVDALADGALGRLVDPTSPEQIADAIIDALEGRMQANAGAAHRFSFANFSRQVDELVASLH